MSKSDDPKRREKMAAIVPEKVLNTIGIIGTTDEVHALLQRRFVGIVDRLRCDSLLGLAGPV